MTPLNENEAIKRFEHNDSLTDIVISATRVTSADLISNRSVDCLE